MFHLSQMDQIFLKSLADVVRLSRSTASYDQLTMTSQVIADIKTEMQSKSEQIRYQALLKLFFVKNRAHLFSSSPWKEIPFAGQSFKSSTSWECKTSNSS